MFEENLSTVIWYSPVECGEFLYRQMPWQASKFSQGHDILTSNLALDLSDNIECDLWELV